MFYSVLKLAYTTKRNRTSRRDDVTSIARRYFDTRWFPFVHASDSTFWRIVFLRVLLIFGKKEKETLEISIVFFFYTTPSYAIPREKRVFPNLVTRRESNRRRSRRVLRRRARPVSVCTSSCDTSVDDISDVGYYQRSRDPGASVGTAAPSRYDSDPPPPPARPYSLGERNTSICDFRITY